MNFRLFTITPILLAMIFSLGLLSGCSGKRPVEAKEISTNSDPMLQVRMLETDVAEAQSKDVHVLSPGWFEKAEESLIQAKTMIKKGRSLDALMETLGKGRGQLQRANEMANVARTSLPKAIEARSDARSAGATEFSEKYKQTEKAFLDMTRSIEDDHLRSAKEKESQVTKKFRDLELAAIKKNAIGTAKTLIEKAKTQNAKRLTPKTWKQASQALQDADQFITQSRYQKNMIKEKAGNALFQARRLVNMVRYAAWVKQETPEQVALSEDQMLRSYSEALQAPDMGSQPFSKRKKQIAVSIQELRKDRAALASENKQQKERLVNLESKTKNLTDEQRRLAAEKRFNKLFDSARSLFSSNEAEVYKEGDKALIRLKKVQFPVGKYVLRPENYALLTKVQKAIRLFGDPDVIVEGHTDSTGSDALNEHLSKKRAMAVRDYLVANETVDPYQIVSVGYGSKKPIASNETKDGRKMNRRIDVVIQPESKKASGSMVK